MITLESQWKSSGTSKDSFKNMEKRKDLQDGAIHPRTRTKSRYLTSALPGLSVPY